MDNATLFLMMSGLSGLGWVLLILVSPCWKDADKAVIGVIVLVLGCAYGFFNFTHLREVGGITAFSATRAPSASSPTTACNLPRGPTSSPSTSWPASGCFATPA
jgi:hypothetical protein